MQHFALVYTYLLVDVREGKGPVVMFSELWGFHLPGLPAWLMPMPSLSTESHENEQTSAEWHGGEYAKQLISVMLVHCSLFRCQVPF